MDRARNLDKLRDNESEYLLGYVFAVSGPGKECLYSVYIDFTI